MDDERLCRIRYHRRLKLSYRRRKTERKDEGRQREREKQRSYEKKSEV
jgi:hypothetical protein